jgi:hypothetical protein
MSMSHRFRKSILKKQSLSAGSLWLMPVILAAWEAEIRRIAV